MPKNKFQDAVFTAIMAAVMVYGMIVYNVAWNTDGVSTMTFLPHCMKCQSCSDCLCAGIFYRRQTCNALAFQVMRPMTDRS